MQPAARGLCADNFSDRVVNIVFPLGVGFLDRMMEEYDQWDVLPLRLFVDFVLRVRDAEGRNVYALLHVDAGLLLGLDSLPCLCADLSDLRILLLGLIPCTVL